MQSKAATVEQYLAELPPERRDAIQSIRRVVLDNIDKRIEEGMQYGMIGFYVPHSVYPNGYHCDPRQPLPYACLASQKNYMSLYVMNVYADTTNETWLRNEWAKRGKKLDMGKCCIRFKKLEDLPLDVIGEMFRRVTVNDHIAFYEKALTQMGKSRKPASRTAAKKPATRTKAAKKKTVKRRKAAKSGRK